MLDLLVLRVRPVLQGLPDLQVQSDPSARSETGETQDPVPLSPGPLDPLALEVRQVQRDLQDQLELQVLQDPQVLLEIQVLRDQLELQVLQVQLEHKDLQVKQEHRDPPDPQVQRDPLVLLQDRLGPLVQWV